MNDKNKAPIGIFVSHRMEDQEIALKLRTKLERDLAKNKIEVHVCTETQGEKNWRSWIEEKIIDSQIMIFLYTVEHEEAWRWCMYEIGMFNGLRLRDKNRSLIFLKNPHIKDLPDPLRDVTFYEASSKGIEFFLEQLLFSDEHTPDNRIIVTDDERSSTWDKKYERALNELKSVFKRSRLSIEYYNYRVTIELRLSKSNNGKSRIEKSTITGDQKTMHIFNIPRTSFSWEDLYRHFKRMGQVKWLKELEKVAENVANGITVDRVLHPLSVKNQRGLESYLPVVSSIEKMYPLTPDGQHEPTKINVIFIPQNLSQEGLLEKLPTLIPFSKVRCKLEPGEIQLSWKLVEEEDAVQVVEMNPLCLKLYNLRQDEFDRVNRKISGSQLIERLRWLELVDEENINKLTEDQGRVITQLLLKGFNKVEAIIPLQFNEKHPSYPNQSFLPVIVSSQIEEEQKDRRIAYLLVAYVKDFWPADHPENPFNVEKDKKGKPQN